MEVHDLIRKIRKYLEIKQIDMASQLDMDPKTYRKIENGFVRDVPEQTIIEIAKLLNINPDLLLNPDSEALNNLHHAKTGMIKTDQIILSDQERSLYERLLAEKESTIARLREEVAFMKKLDSAEY